MTRFVKGVIMWFLSATAREQSHHASARIDERADMQRDMDDTQARLDYVRYEARMLGRALKESDDGTTRRTD